MYEEFQALSLVPAFWLMGTLVVATLTDVTSHRIPNTLLAPALSIAILAATAFGGMHGLQMAIAGFGVGLAMMLPLYLIGGMGAGDVKLLAVAGAFLGPHGALIAGVMTFVAGALFGLIWLAWRVVHPSINYVQENRLAYAPAIAAGASISIWYQGWPALIAVS